MNQKICKYTKANGYCCLWAFFEQHRAVYTSILYESLAGVCTLRALQKRRAAYRARKLKCEGCTGCLKESRIL